MLNLLYSSLAEDELVVLQDKLCNDSSHTDLHGLSSFKIISCPLTVTISAKTSTSIDVQWTALPLPCQTFQTKFVTGYVIFYKEDGADGYQKVTKKSFVRRTILKGLKKFTKYQIVVSPFSENGNGVPSLPVRNATLEDVPSVAPVITETHATSPISLNLTWTAVDPSYWHGIPRGYCVTYRARGSIITRSLDITDLTQLNVTISGLRPFSLYYINVAAKTSPGCGAEASVQVLTREDAPDGPPQDITARNTSSTSILVQWDYVLPTERNGVILGYRVSYIKYGVVKSVGVQGFRTKQVEITGLDIFTEYSFHVLAYNRIGDGPESSEVIAMTDESTPSEAPLLVKAVNTSSSSIILQWQGISTENSNGILLGYRIYYRPANTKWESKVAEVQSNSTFELELTNLFLWWLYEIQIGAYTRVGTGVKTNASVQTDEDFPSRYPENIRGIALTTTSMSLEWDPVLPGFVHGNLLGYNLTMRQTEDFDNVVVETILPPYERSYYVQGLKKFTNYTIWVRAINSKGQGAVYLPGHINSTGEDGPEIPPEDITVSTLEDISVINIEWTRIPQKFHNGILRGYYVEYTATVLAGQFIATEDRVVQSVRIRGNRYATVLRDLDPGSTYEIKVFGYTIKNGTKSNGTLGETCRCPKYIRTNWWVMPPYTNTSNPASPGGIFFTVAETVLDGLCGICENGHGRTEICFEEGCDKRRRRRSTSNSYQKNSLQDVVSDIDGNTEISFPVQGNKYMTTYAGVFPYISVVDAPGSAYFTVKNVPSTAEVVVNAVIACMPLVVLMILFAWLAGIIIWFLERKENSEHFPESFTSGVPEGFWWAFVSMTTVGYGDRSPVTIPGRLFAIAWILMGLVIISIVTGGIVTSITSVLVVQEDKIYGAQVGAIVNSSEYRKAVRQNADVVGYNNMEEIINAMKNKEIAGALIDMYAAATKKHLFEMDKDIQMNRMIEYPTGCGIVLSGNMAKAAPLFYEALATYKGEVSRIVEENTDTISQDRNEAEEAKEKSSGLFDPTAEAFRGSFNVTIGLLVAVIAAGLTWHYGVYRRRKVRRKWELDELSLPLQVCNYQGSGHNKSDQLLWEAKLLKINFIQGKSANEKECYNAAIYQRHWKLY